MKRRDFIRTGALAGAAAVIMPRFSAAGGMKKKMAGGLYYTEDHQGRWQGHGGGHVPQLQLDGSTLNVETNHPMNGYDHYIVKHQVLDADYNFMDEHMFDPLNDTKPVSSFDIGDYRGKLYVLSVCNIHDTWLNSIEV